MRVLVRLNWRYDLDIISLCACPSFKTSLYMKKALVSYANGHTYLIPVPETLASNVTLGSLSLRMSLNENNPDDKKAIELLNAVKPMLKGAFIKAIFRSFLPPYNLAAFYDDSITISKENPWGKKTERKKTVTPKEQAPPIIPKKDISSKTANIMPPPVPVAVFEKPDNSLAAQDNIFADSHLDEPHEENPGVNDGFDIFGAVGNLDEQF